MCAFIWVQLAGRNSHHIIEATFKAFARALRQATEYDPRRRGTVPRYVTLKIMRIWFYWLLAHTTFVGFSLFSNCLMISSVGMCSSKGVLSRSWYLDWATNITDSICCFKDVTSWWTLAPPLSFITLLNNRMCWVQVFVKEVTAIGIC